MTENQRIILGDALDTLGNFHNTYSLKDKELRKDEQQDLIERVIDDIKTVLRLEK